MKRRILFTSVFLLAAFFSSELQAQYINYKDDSGWNFGLNVGGTWQQSDVRSKAGLAGGFTIGKALWEREGRLLAFDLRLRYLTGYNSGFDLTPSSDFDTTGHLSQYAGNSVYHNHQMRINSMWDLEGVLTLHRLREKTGIILYGFGGVGLTGYTLKTDIQDGLGLPYDYNTIGTNSIFDTETELELSRDGNYETTLHKGYEFMPSLGFGLGYQFTPVFSMGLEHKINFPIHDRLDGVESTSGPFVNDRLHYTALTFRFNLGAGRPSRKPPVATNTPVTPPPPAPLLNKPVVNIINPMHSPYPTHNNTYRVKANVYYVDGRSNITFRHNGMISNNFTYNASSKRFESNLFLVPGKNTIEVIGKNRAGYDSDSKVIIYEQSVNTIPPPVVTFTNPSYSPKYVTQSAFTITANVLHVSGPQDITFRVNGVINPSFHYNVSNQLFSSNILLSEGQNTIEIKGVNSAGQDIESVMIIYKEPVQLRPPVVTFVNPSSNPENSESALYNVQAQVLHVDYAHQIQVLLNGLNVPAFNFNSITNTVTFQASLIEGSNTVTIIATNNDGTDSESTALVYHTINELQPPIVTITMPTENPKTTNNPSAVVYANVINVSGKGDIDLKINSVSTTNFSYNTITKVMTISTSLVEGTNVFSITGSNAVGTDNAGTTIIYDKPNTMLPPVISITKPFTNPYNTVSSNELINATILHVTEASNVAATFNGVNTTDFTFDPLSRKFSFNANLVVGANILEIDAWNNAGSASKSQTIIYTNEAPPCNDPVITITQPVTNPTVITTSKITISGVISDDGKPKVLINGNAYSGFKFDSSTGVIGITASGLKEGANSVEIIATNSCGTSKHQLTIIYEKKDPPCLEPAIGLLFPNSYSTSVKGNQLKFTAKVANVNDKKMISLVLNGSEQPFDYSAKLVSTMLSLNYGNNELILTAKNNCGSDQAKFKINAEKVILEPTPKPSVEFTDPNTASYVSESPVFTVIAKTKNVNNSSEISMNLEGESVAFSFDATTNTIKVPMDIEPGSHSLAVTVTTENGIAKDEVELIYNEQEPCETPVITMDPQFTGQTTVSTETGKITGSIANALAVVVKENGSNYSDFSFDESTGRITIKYTSLKQGINTFNNVAHSPCGKDSEDITLNYEPISTPCDKPILVIAEASGSSVNVTADNGMFTAYLENATGVTVNKDGAAHSDFSYNQTSGNMVINYSNLHDGANVFTITGTNDCGDTASTYTLNYDEPAPPCDNPQVVVTTTLSGSTLVVTGQSDYLVYSVTNATSVGVTKDGFNHSDYVVKPSTGTLIVKLTTLNEGPNEFVVIVQNDCGTDEKAVTVIYNPPSASEPCGPRFNPGNSDWEFCLITPSGTFNRSDLNSGFSYSGSASSAFFKPIAGGGDAIVGGKSYALSNGQYYLFTGALSVTVSNNQPGSMGHWTICIESNTSPVSGNGQNRPSSPCETSNTGGNNGSGNPGNGNNGGGNSGNGNGNSGGGNNGKNPSGGGNGNGNPKSGNTDSDAARKAAEAARKAEEARKAEAARKAAEAARKAEEARKAEAARKAAEAARKAQEKKLIEEKEKGKENKSIPPK